MNADLDTLPSLRELVERFDIRAKKSLGQNFLFDQNLTDKIARVPGNLSNIHVIEIGPGPGGLTRSLLKTNAKEISAVEFDPRAVSALQGLIKFAQGRLNVIEGDALKIDFTNIASTGPRVIIANLPYNIATPLLIGWLKKIHENRDFFQSITIMVQREVAERIAAQHSTSDYGRLSIITQWLCDTKIMFDVPPEAFSPPPKVTSSIIHLVPKKSFQVEPSFKDMERLTASAFNQRRKMIRQSLKAYLPAIESLGIDPTLRAENLTLDDFLNLALKL